MVSELAFYSGNLSLNPAEAYNLSAKIVFEKVEYNQKENRIGPYISKKRCAFKIHSFHQSFPFLWNIFQSIELHRKNEK